MVGNQNPLELAPTFSPGCRQHLPPDHSSSTAGEPCFHGNNNVQQLLFKIPHTETLKLLTCADSSIDTKTVINRQKGEKKNIIFLKYISHVRCHISGVMCQVSGFMCCVSPVVCHLSGQEPTGWATDPPPANFLNMHSRLVHKDPKTQRRKTIQNADNHQNWKNLKKPEGRFSEKKKQSLK